LHWKFFATAKSVEKAQRVISVAIEKLSVTVYEFKIEPYHKGGFVCSFLSHPGSAVWSEIVVEVLNKAQAVGRNWLVNGDISSELDLWSNEPSINGLESIHLYVSKNA